MDFEIKSKTIYLPLKVPAIMAILNVTPDSFFDGGVYNSETAAINKVEEMLQEGADIIDVGAYSSRPGAMHINEEEEYTRLKIIITLKRKFPEAVFSVDTFRSTIIEKLYNEIGDFIVNDISGGTLDSDMLKTVGALGLPYVCMHMQGTPQTMQNKPEYENILTQQLLFFEDRISKANKNNISSIIIDPGFGFGKTIEHNFTLLKNLPEFSSLNKPILVGISRKSMINLTLQITPKEALNGTTALHMASLIKGANILRVHDVKPAKECVTLFECMNFSI